MYNMYNFGVPTAFPTLDSYGAGSQPSNIGFSGLGGLGMALLNRGMRKPMMQQQPPMQRTQQMPMQQINQYTGIRTPSVYPSGLGGMIGNSYRLGNRG